MQQQALVLKSIKELEIQNINTITDLGPNEVLIKTAFVGICGSDIHYWQEGEIGDFKLKKPMIMGHETSGIIHKLGPNLINTSLQIGDRVCVEPGIPCRSCHYCRTGKYNLCPDIKFHATPPYDGTLQEYFIHPSDFCYKLPEGMSLELGALVEPMAVAYFALKRSRFQFGQTVFVSGAGPIGLCCLVAALKMGAALVYITDVLENRLRTAKLLGAHHALRIIPGNSKFFSEVATPSTSSTLNSFSQVHTGNNEDPQSSGSKFDKTTNSSADISSFFKTHGLPDVTFEATGSESGLDLALQATKPGGKLVCIGFSFYPTKIKFFNVLVKQIDIIGIFRYANCFPETIDLLAKSSNKSEIERLMITHMFHFSDSLKAYEVARDNSKHEAIKVMIKMPGI